LYGGKREAYQKELRTDFKKAEEHCKRRQAHLERKTKVKAGQGRQKKGSVGLAVATP